MARVNEKLGILEANYGDVNKVKVGVAGLLVDADAADVDVSERQVERGSRATPRFWGRLRAHSVRRPTRSCFRTRCKPRRCDSKSLARTKCLAP